MSSKQPGFVKLSKNDAEDAQIKFIKCNSEWIGFTSHLDSDTTAESDESFVGLGGSTTSPSQLVIEILKRTFRVSSVL